MILNDDLIEVVGDLGLERLLKAEGMSNCGLAASDSFSSEPSYTFVSPVPFNAMLAIPFVASFRRSVYNIL